MNKFFKSFGYAFEGIVEAIKTQQNVRIHLVAAIAVIALGFICRVTVVEWCILLACSAIVISAELFNTAIENLTDSIYNELHPKAKLIKDVAAGAVLILAIASAVIGVIIFAPYLSNIWFKLTSGAIG